MCNSVRCCLARRRAGEELFSVVDISDNATKNTHHELYVVCRFVQCISKTLTKGTVEVLHEKRPKPSFPVSFFPFPFFSLFYMSTLFKMNRKLRPNDKWGILQVA